MTFPAINGFLKKNNKEKRSSKSFFELDINHFTLEYRRFYKKMQKFIKNTGIFIIGAIGYGIIEILFRGYTHWTMLVTGGIVFVILYHVYTKRKSPSLAKMPYRSYNYNSGRISSWLYH